MTDAAVDICQACGAVLAPWEKGRCACQGPRWRSIREILYCISCTAAEPLHAHDFVRNAERDYGLPLSQPTAIAALAPDPRFCWAGRGVYGLYRHGPLPGPRNLEEATRVVLVAAGRRLTHDTVDFCLKRFGYRYNLASLRNAMARSAHILWLDGQWDHRRGEAAELELRDDIRIVPPRQRASWNGLRARIGAQIEAAIADRNARLQALTDPRRFGIDWDPDLNLSGGDDGRR
jgi:hypothetical protein